MRRFELDHEHEGFVLNPLFLEPLGCEFGYDIGGVSVDFLFAVWRDEIGIVVEPLARKNLPVVKALGMSLEVGFSVDRGLVADFLEKFGKSLLVPVKRVSIVS